jgi:hypothetical protein
MSCPSHSPWLDHKRKGKFIPDMNSLSTTPWRRVGEWRYNFNILNLGTRRRWVVSFTPWALYPRETVPGTHWTGRRDGMNILYWDSNYDSSEVAIPTEPCLDLLILVACGQSTSYGNNETNWMFSLPVRMPVTYRGPNTAHWMEWKQCLSVTATPLSKQCIFSKTCSHGRQRHSVAERLRNPLNRLELLAQRTAGRSKELTSIV